MAKLPPPNLPPAAMPWARDIEKRLGDAGTKASRAYTNVGAFGQVIADVNNRTVTQTLDIEAHETKLTENAEAVAQAEAEIAALNAPGGPLDTLDQELQALDTQLNDPVTGISAQVAEFDEQLNTPLTGIADVVAAHTVDLGDLDDALNDPVTGVRPAIDQLESDMNDPVTGVKAELDAAQSDLTNLTKVGGTLDVMQGEIDDKLDNLPGVITETLISDDAVTTSKIVANAITANELAVGAITASKAVIADGAILNAQIGDAAISAAKIQDAAIISAKIQDGAIVNAKIQNGTIQHAKIGTVSADSMTLGTLKAERIGAGTISTEKLVIGAGSSIVPWNIQATTAPHSARNGVTVSRANDADLGWCMYVTGGTIPDGTLGQAVQLMSGTTARTGGIGDFDVEAGATYRFRAGFGVGGNHPAGFSREVNVSIAVFSSLTEYTWIVSDPLTVNSYGSTPDYLDFQFTVPQNAVAIRPFISKSTWSDGTYFIVEPTIVRAVSGELVVDGAITAEKVAAKSIGANKLLVGDFENMIADVIGETNELFPHVAGFAATFFDVGTITADSAGNNPGANIAVSISPGTNQYFVTWGGTNGTSRIPVEPNTEYYASVLVRRTQGGVSDTSWALREYDVTGTQVAFRGAGDWQPTTTLWTPMGTSFTTGPTTTHVEMYTRARSDLAISVRIANPSLRRKNGGSLIVDGSIVANHIATRTITAEKIGTGEITANEIKTGTITANEITTGYLTGIKISAGEITGTTINGGTITGTDITGTSTITGATVQTASSGDRIVMDNGNQFKFYHSLSGWSYMRPDAWGINFESGYADVFIGSGSGVGGTDWGGVVMLGAYNGSTMDAVVETDVVKADKRIVQAGHPIAYRQAAGRASIPGTSINPNTSVQFDVSFPTGRFTQPPIVNGNSNVSPLIVSIQEIYTTYVRLRVYNPHTAAISTSGADVAWTATQMLTTNASG